MGTPGTGRRPFAALVRQMRQRAMLTQAELAERADVSAQLVGNTESGETTPQPESFRRLARGLGLSPEQTPEDFAVFERAWRQQRTGSAAPAREMPGSTDGSDAKPRDEKPQGSAKPAPATYVRRRWPWLLGAAVVAVGVLVALALTAWRHPASPTNADRYAIPAGERLGGLWTTPRTDGFTLGGETVRLSAHAFAKDADDPPVAYVVFTANWPALGGTWRVLCEVRQPRAGSDEYECPVNAATEGIPSGPISLSFDVYDDRGFHPNSPHGARRGHVGR
jgi:transcriptional regulator with XRE-family HTH domain